MLTDKAIAWIEKQPPDEPFFLYFTPVAVHEPSTPSVKVKGTSRAGPYGDWIHELDLSLGRVLDALDQRGQAERTLFIFTRDNGGTITNRDNYSLRAVERGLAINGQWRDGKTAIYEGGFRVPFLVRWPGQVPPGTVCDETISLVDLFATVAAVVGDKLPPPSMRTGDSYNVLPAFLGEEPGGSMREQLVLHSWDGTFAIRQGPWKWIAEIPHKPGRKPNPQELYNLLEDPQETNNVLDKHPEVAKQLTGLLAKYRDQGNSR